MNAKRLCLLLVCALGCLRCLGVEIRGRVQIASSGCPASGLSVEIDPVKGSAQSKIATATTTDGTFSVQVLSGLYLVQIFQNGGKVYQGEVIAQPDQVVNISVRASTQSGIKICAPADAVPWIDKLSAPETFSMRTSDSKEWRPLDLSFNPHLGLLVLDDVGRVTQLHETQQGVLFQVLLRLPLGGQPLTLASSGTKIFVVNKNDLGCTIYSWDEATKRLQTKLLIGAIETCGAIATDGRKLAVAFGDSAAIRYFTDLNTNQSHTIEIPGLEGARNMVLDLDNRHLLIGDAQGKVFQCVFGLPGCGHQVIDHAGMVNSLAVSAKYLLIASGSRMLCFDRRTFESRAILSCLTLASNGEIVGIRIDDQDRAWVLLRDQNALLGPIPLR